MEKRSRTLLLLLHCEGERQEKRTNDGGEVENEGR